MATRLSSTAKDLGDYYRELHEAGIPAELTERLVFDAATSVHCQGVVLKSDGAA